MTAAVAGDMLARDDAEGGRPRSGLALAAIGVLALAAFASFVALGLWQIERRAWKLDLISRVETRLAAEPVAAPGPAAWPDVDAARYEYLRVTLSGVFDHSRETLVQAATGLGSGFWTLTPLKTAQGFEVLVNRGFVRPERRAPATRADGLPRGPVAVTGLLRLTEPDGAFLRANEPDRDLWRSRDVAAIAAARGLTEAAPYFVDADGRPNAGGWPVGGLTVVGFRNNHLVYALTWFGLALMVAGGAGLLARHELRLRGAPRG
ncbi:SURF1-like protein [Methylopila turkensis]|uniref:SURF1-like protein n=2 Tax=Methylopila turkensis TaxID=1437816 RepID=A0A9W6JMN5_9HYPH|nr:SURF1 family protein [Methylopila turkensis]GLK79206.1 SURF1-like protein [Methylopila turkensis]